MIDLCNSTQSPDSERVLVLVQNKMEYTGTDVIAQAHVFLNDEDAMCQFLHDGIDGIRSSRHLATRKKRFLSEGTSQLDKPWNMSVLGSNFPSGQG